MTQNEYDQIMSCIQTLEEENERLKKEIKKKNREIVGLRQTVQNFYEKQEKLLGNYGRKKR